MIIYEDSLPKQQPKKKKNPQSLKYIEGLLTGVHKYRKSVG